MATKKAVWGIDVGQCALKAIKLQAAGDGVEILEFAVIEHEKILSHPNVDAPELIKAAVEKFRTQHEVKNDLVVIGVPGQQTLSRFIKLPPVEPKKIPDIVRYEAQQQIPFDMDEVVWDYQTFTESDAPDVEVGIFAIRKELIRKHIDYFSAAGIEPVLAQASPLAMYNAFCYDQGTTDQATILLDIGTQTTDLIVVEGNSIWARPVPIGGNAFTEALVRAFKLSHTKAEHLKRNASSSKYARQIFQAMRPVFADLISEVQRSIGFYTAMHRDSEISRIVGVGNAFILPGLQKFMQQNLQIDAQRFAKFDKATLADAAKTNDFNNAVPSLLVAYGLAVQGLGLGSISSSLLPPEIARQLVWQRKSGPFGLAAACFAAAAGVIWFSNQSAQGTISNLGAAQPAPIADVPAAKAALQRSPDGDPLRYAKTIEASVNKLKSRYDEVKNLANEDSQTVLKFADLGKFNPIVPRIMQAVHSAFEEQAPGLPVSSGREYMQLVRDAQTKRDNLVKGQGVSPDDPRIQELDRIIHRHLRKELWITEFEMVFEEDLLNKINAWGEDLVPEKEKTEVTGVPGWFIRLYCHTTFNEPEGWLDDTVLPAILEAGRKPKMGFYFANAKLIPKPAKIRDLSKPMVRMQGAFGGGGQGGGAAQPRGGRGGGRGAGLGGRGFQPGSPPSAPTPQENAPDDRLRLKLGHDPLLPKEKWFESDWDVWIEILVPYRDAPANVLKKPNKDDKQPGDMADDNATGGGGGDATGG
jgi:type IV pilus assembly protein PilM